MERVPLALDDKHHFFQVYNKQKKLTISSPLICFLQGIPYFPLRMMTFRLSKNYFVAKSSISIQIIHYKL